MIDKGAIAFKDVHFAYDPARPILKGISFEVPAGKTVAVVGPSGAGKSTLSRLLYRFYDVQEGAITIDGQDVRDVTQKSLRAVIGMVPQDTVLFNDTIAYNIRYGRTSATRGRGRGGRRYRPDRRVHREPARGLRHHGRRARPETFGRREAARGHRPHHPEEPADPDPRRGDLGARHPYRAGIQSALDVVSKNRTTLVIAHRLSTVVNADEIIVLEGRRDRRARHPCGLIDRDGLYASMWNRQREATQAEEKLKKVRESDDLGVVVRGAAAV